MTEQQAIGLIQKEFKDKTLGVTEQYLKIHSPIFVDNKLKVDRIDRDRKDEQIITYLPVLDENFYFAVYIDTKTNKITSFRTEAYHRVYFSATSETLSADELKAMTRLIPTEAWNKGDLRNNGIIGGYNIDTDDIRRMNDLWLSINFDLYVGGHSFKE